MDSLMKLEIGNQMFYIKKVTEETSSGDGIISDPPLSAESALLLTFNF